MSAKFQKIPQRLRHYVERLRGAPGSHITSFLVLHEITAIAPVIGLFYAFHQLNWTPASVLPDAWVEKGTKRMERVAHKYGCESLKGEKGIKMVLEGGAAFAVVKALLPLRIAVSLAMTPWFARRLVGPIVHVFKRRV